MRKTASGIIALLILAGALLWVSILAFYSLTEHVDYLGADEEPHLYFFWRSLRWIVGGGAVGPAFAALLAVAGVCSQALARLHRHVATVVLVAVACLLGVLACVTVMIVTGEEGGSVIRSLRGAVGGDEADLRSAIRLFMGSMVLWFVTMMGTQLGISIVNENGAVRAFFKRRGQRSQ